MPSGLVLSEGKIFHNSFNCNFVQHIKFITMVQKNEFMLTSTKTKVHLTELSLMKNFPIVSEFTISVLIIFLQ